jgi:hypothetical protein
MGDGSIMLQGLGGGPSKLSLLEIDTDKDWQGYDITNLGEIQVNDLVTAGEVSTLGSEKVVNGGFDTDTDWTKTGDCIISGGVATWGTVTGNTGTLYPTTPLSIVIGKQYKLTFDAGLQNSHITASCGGFSTGQLTAGGTLTFVFTASATTNLLFDGTISPGGKGNLLTVDNVSLVECGNITGAIMAERFVLRASAEFESDGVVDFGESQYGIRRMYLGSPSLGYNLPDFRGLCCTEYTNGDMYIGNDNVFPGYYVQKTVTHGSTAGDNSTDITNLYQGDSLYPIVSLMYAIEYDGVNLNGVEIGAGATDPPPLYFSDDYEIKPDPANQKIMFRPKGGTAATMAILEIGLEHKTTQECVRPDTDNKIDLGDTANTLRWRNIYAAGSIDAVGGFAVAGAAGHTGWIDDGVNFRATITGGIITAVGNSVAGGWA